MSKTYKNRQPDSKFSSTTPTNTSPKGNSQFSMTIGSKFNNPESPTTWANSSQKKIVATEHHAPQTNKIPREFPTMNSTEMIPVEKKIKKLLYTVREKQIIHCPSQTANRRQFLQSQGIAIRDDAEYREIDPKLIYKYSEKNRNSPIGYCENGHRRVLSNSPSFFRMKLSPKFGQLKQPEVQNAFFKSR